MTQPRIRLTECLSFPSLDKNACLGYNMLPELHVKFMIVQICDVAFGLTFPYTCVAHTPLFYYVVFGSLNNVWINLVFSNDGHT